MARVAPIARLDRAGPVVADRSLVGHALQRMLRNRLAMAGLVIVVGLVLVAVLADVVAPHDPNAQDCATGALRGPSAGHLLGTDGTCRDVLSRLIHGSRVSLSVGILSQVAILFIALPIGTFAAMGGRLVDNLLMRFTDLVYAFPELLAIILLRQVLEDAPVPGGSLFVIIAAISLVGWVTMARLVRGQMLSLKEREYVTAARAAGAGGTRLALVHMLPNSLGPIIVVLTFGVPMAIFAEAALSFIGIGMAPPTATWGGMVDSGYRAVFGAPMLVVYPAVAIAITMMAFSFIGDGLRDALDPRSAR